MSFKIKKQYRLQSYDYAIEGLYFITICIKDRRNYFGKIVNERIQLYEIGEAAEFYWSRIPEKHGTVELDERVIMPNHLHGILAIKDISQNTPRRLPTGNIHPLVKNSVSSIINHYKGNVKRYCNKNKMEYFEWQSRFYDHVIRDEDSLNKIREYIVNNPLKWELEKGNPENLYM